tara:strand:+ start:473 stop:739 length:267 start_codon:yes stop_codon:yes gene_type:complete
MKLTSKKVRDYMSWRTDEELKHCPECIAAACNDMAEELNYNAKELMKLLFFNDPIPMLHTHNYGFHTATGRILIEKLKSRYYEHESTN